MKTQVVTLTINYDETVYEAPIHWDWQQLIDAGNGCEIVEIGYAIAVEQGELQ